MKKNLLIVLVLIFCFSAFSQEKQEYNVDSLLNRLILSRDTITTIKKYNDEIVIIYNSGVQLDKSKLLELINTNIEIGREINDREGIAWASYNLARYHIASNSGYSRALPILLETTTLFEELGIKLGTSKCYMQMGLISYMTQYYEDAIKHFELSLNEHSNPTSTYLMAISFTELDSFSMAKAHFHSAINQFKSVNRLDNINECYMYLGKMFVQEGNLDSAYYYLNTALENIKISKNNYLSRPYALFSEYYLKTGELNVAEFYALSSIEIAKETNDNLSPIIASAVLGEVYEKEKDFEKAHLYLKLHYNLRNNEFQGGVKQKIAEMQTIFEFKKKIDEEKRKHEEEIRKKNQTKNVLLVVGLFILLLAGGLWSRLQFVRKSKKELQKEKNISETLLLNILPEEIALELKESGEAKARSFDLVSILFTDFKDFTEQSAKLSPAELVKEINICFQFFDSIIEKYDVEKIKTIGDAYMAASGLPVPKGDSVKNTVLAALEMQSFIVERKTTMDAEGKPAFEMRIGIHTGPVVAGIVGVKKFQYDIWGDTVNTASRMESAGEVGKVNISQATYELLKDDSQFAFESRGKIEAKGKGTLEMYFVSVKESQDEA